MENRHSSLFRIFKRIIEIKKKRKEYILESCSIIIHRTRRRTMMDTFLAVSFQFTIYATHA